MKVCGIIAEYNPFHNGHRFHIEETRRRTGADYCIVIMSGDFLQRGGPAVVDKYLRAECALENGADLVIQMPVTGSTASAGEYAKCGVTLLSRLGVVTDLSFGCEAETDEEKEILFEAAGYLYTEPDCFQTILSEGMRRGMTFPPQDWKHYTPVLGMMTGKSRSWKNSFVRPITFLLWNTCMPIWALTDP